ncbi:hypothetical protein C8J56DRAFT_1100990 [Mycena floridula]|nr:hypothetical protein C8J56DRAFT_1100990 [Mycena floridula]
MFFFFLTMFLDTSSRKAIQQPTANIIRTSSDEAADLGAAPVTTGDTDTIDYMRAHRACSDAATGHSDEMLQHDEDMRLKIELHRRDGWRDCTQPCPDVSTSVIVHPPMESGGRDTFFDKHPSLASLPEPDTSGFTMPQKTFRPVVVRAPASINVVPRYFHNWFSNEENSDSDFGSHSYSDDEYDTDSFQVDSVATQAIGNLSVTPETGQVKSSPRIRLVCMAVTVEVEAEAEAKPARDIKNVVAEEDSKQFGKFLKQRDSKKGAASSRLSKGKNSRSKSGAQDSFRYRSPVVDSEDESEGIGTAAAGGNNDSGSEPSDSSSSCSSSDSSSKDVKSKKRQRSRSSAKKRDHSKKYKLNRKDVKRALKSTKVKTPTIYDGSPDIKVFDKFCFELDNWRELLDISDSVAVKMASNFLSDKASDFFMDHVARKQHKWNIPKVYDAMFEYCFPSDIKERLRAELVSLKQGSRNIQDFAVDIESRARRFPDMTARTLVQILWDGVPQFIRVKWRERGFSPESTSFERLERYGIRYEQIQEMIDREQKESQEQSGNHQWDKCNQDDDDEPCKNDSSRSHGSPILNASGDRDPVRKAEPKQKRIPQEEFDQLWAEGRCFTCKEVGHESRNCPTRGFGKKPTIVSGAATYGYTEHEDSEHSGDGDSDE